MVNGRYLLTDDGRLQDCQLDYNAEQLIVLPIENCLAVCMNRHVLHGGSGDRLAQLRKMYWVLGGSPLVKNTPKECTTCQRGSSRAATRVAAPLLADDISQAAPFEVTGVDFAGPLGGIRRATGQGWHYNKGLHRNLPVRCRASTPAASFLLVFRRVIARRNVASTVYSDNALIFSKTSKRVAVLWMAILNDDVRSVIANPCVEWKFIVDRAPG
ncbi:hypothetical protein HPB48_011185 [Haemaphysalis longicornis]|uniref:Integrase zinc-binding domain-containing protein n=1 Tax=Haemaphysalis longicornis TaxID=44386 RepID=A0A9J6FNE7_HAELO|nr:hypothetical protein HPB48_011185 [Haemaphysalis longicornis]